MMPPIALVSGARAGGPLPEGIAELARMGRARLVGARLPGARITDSAALIGYAFYRAGPGPCEQLSSEECRQIVESAGRWAIEELWGNYLLFWADFEGAVHMLRSPMTGPALFHVVESGPGGAAGRAACAFTDLALARALGFPLDRLDPARVDAQLRFGTLREPECEIAGMTEILPGEIAVLGAPGRLAASWSPWDHVQRPPRRVRSDELRDQVSRVVSAWSMRFERIQLELSGGIDSSILAACLAGRRRPWRGFTLATADPDGDERLYARAVAERVGVSLGEAARPPVGDPLAPIARLRPRPGGFGLLAPSDTAYLRAARDYGADAIFTGTGGDNLFGYMTSTAPILDALRFAGPAAALGAARDLARLANDNVWKALGYAARRMIWPPPLWSRDNSFLSARFAGPRPRHPWFADANRGSPGQQHYAMKLLVAQPFLDGYDRALAMPMIAPLLSQPLVEFGLAVPSWQWGEGGLNRALARNAFRGDLPALVLDRTSKGRILSAFLPALEAHRARLRPYLLDGWLAGEGLLDLDALAPLLSNGARVDPVATTRILSITDIERWARAVTSGGSATL